LLLLLLAFPAVKMRGGKGKRKTEKSPKRFFSFLLRATGGRKERPPFSLMGARSHHTAARKQSTKIFVSYIHTFPNVLQERSTRLARSAAAQQQKCPNGNNKTTIKQNNTKI
jgi:hypothetical protein